MFKCKGCELDKPAAEFRIHKKGYRIGKCRDCERAYQREWSIRDPETHRRRKRESMARRRAINIDAARAYARAHHFKNHEANKAAMRAYAARRFFWTRSMHLRGPNRATAASLASLWRRQRGLCALTGRRLDRTAQIDHVLPKARGGDDSILNLRWTCEAVNIAKRHMTDAEFSELCSDVMHWIGKRIAIVDAISDEGVA